MSGSSSLFVNLLLSPATKSALPSKVTVSSKEGKDDVMFGFDRNDSMFSRQRGAAAGAPSPDWVLAIQYFKSCQSKIEKNACIEAATVICRDWFWTQKRIFLYGKLSDRATVTLFWFQIQTAVTETDIAYTARI